MKQLIRKDNMQQIINFFSGKKTYLVSLVSVVYGVVELVLHHNWTGVLPYILGGAFGGAIRAGVAKVEKKLPAPVDAVINKATGL